MTLNDYRPIVGDKIISEIYRLARDLYGAKVLHINSTYYGGGVAEMLYTLVPLLNDAGISADWRILRGSEDFFTITKKFHNALQGDSINLSEMKKNVYISTNEDFSSYCEIDHDAVIVHDPQPLPLVRFYKKRQPWIWRCHVDLSHPNQDLWHFLTDFILRYDAVIVSAEYYRKEDLPVEQKVIAPVIDPLTAKNKMLPHALIHKMLKKFDIPSDKPLITQISRFDKWKDPLGVVEAFKLIRRKADSRLVLCGSMAADDPEGWDIYDSVKSKAKALIESGDVILSTTEHNVLVNALQRSSAVVIQNSTREGFGLTVTEALWKGKPVVATNVGGIPLQIVDGESGFLVEPENSEQLAQRTLEILQHPEMGKHLGERGREDVRQKFLITRMVYDDLKLLREMIG